jgi:acetylornithine deacetylase/succinyl-diaminopimelate desuccinylase-like protein
MERPADQEKILEYLRNIDPWILGIQKELTAIPSPPFGEGPRGERMAELFRAVGLNNVRADAVGNVLADLSEASHGSGPMMISAHLDTVFPPGTEVEPREENGVIRAPGIADDGRGLAALLGLGKALSELSLHPSLPLVFVATVGEEGMGDLRGVRHLFSQEGEGAHACGFISLDGVGLEQLITQGVGSTRLRIRLRGPGGHSWTDWGTPNPIHLLARILAGMENLPLPPSPRTTATAALWGGGKSINAIPQEAWVDVDLRSEGARELASLEEALLDRCRKVLEDPAPGPPPPAGEAPRLIVEELGRRPPGRTPSDTPLVEAAAAATRALGVTPVITSSSTDANLPMSLGIPALTMGAGGMAGGIHTLDEWYSNQKGPEGILRALLTLLELDRSYPTSE